MFTEDQWSPKRLTESSPMRLLFQDLQTWGKGEELYTDYTHCALAFHKARSLFLALKILGLQTDGRLDSIRRASFWWKFQLYTSLLLQADATVPDNCKRKYTHLFESLFSILWETVPRRRITGSCGNAIELFRGTHSQKKGQTYPSSELMIN